MKAYSRKQAGVIYRAFKEGNIEMTKSAVSKLYDFADRDFDLHEMKLAENLHNAVKAAVGFIFENNYKSAQVSINNAF